MKPDGWWSPTISQFTFIGELLLPLWLLIKGVNVARWQELAHDAHRGRQFP